MKICKKLFLLCTLVVINIFSCAYIHTDIGVEAVKGNKSSKVFKDIYMDEDKIDSLNRDEALKIFADSLGQQGWSGSDIERDEGNTHILGMHQEIECGPRMIDTNLIVGTNFESEYTYKSKWGFGTRTVTINMTPSKKQSYQIVADMTGYGKGKTDVMNFVFIAPGKVKSTNGTIDADGKTVRWDIKDTIINKEERVLTVQYKDPFTLLVLLVIPVAGIVIYIFLRPKKRPHTDKAGLINYRLTHNDMGELRVPVKRIEEKKEEPAVHIKAPIKTTCPECGGPLSEDGTFCEKCCLFF